MHIAAHHPQTSPWDPLQTTPSAMTASATGKGSAGAGKGPAASRAADSSSGSSDSSPTSTATITANDFLQLLVTELQNQDPTADTDPNEYVDQLVQVNSLQQLIQIDQNTEGSSSSSSGSGSSGSGSSGSGSSGTGSSGSGSSGTGAIHQRSTAHGNLSPNPVHPPNFSASANEIAGSLAPQARDPAHPFAAADINHAPQFQGIGLQ
jgi:flagellar basal-body rod modification protein FlgD